MVPKNIETEVEETILAPSFVCFLSVFFDSPFLSWSDKY